MNLILIIRAPGSDERIDHGAVADCLDIPVDWPGYGKGELRVLNVNSEFRIVTTN